jgi:hypothetical protein
MELRSWEPAAFVEEWQADVSADRERVHYLIPRPKDDAYFLRIRIALDE